MLHVAAAPAQDAVRRARVAAARELGVPEEAVPLAADEAARVPLAASSAAACCFRDGATVQPARLVRALRRRRSTRASRSTSGTPRDRSAPTASLETPRGRGARAPRSCVATNAAARRLAAAARRGDRLRQLRRADRARARAARRDRLDGRRGDRRRRMFLHYFRTTDDGRVLMGSGSGPIGFGGRIDERFTPTRRPAARAERGLRRLLPALAGARGRARLGRADRRLRRPPAVLRHAARRRASTTARATPGNGVGPSWLGGQILASLVLRPRRRVGRAAAREPPRAARCRRSRSGVVGGGLVRAAIMACEEAEEEGRPPPLAARAGQRIPRLVGMEIGTRER